MEKVHIGFSRPRGWFKPFSWAIRLCQWTSYSHVYIRSYSASLDRDIVYQASGLQVNFIGLDRFKAEEIIIKEFVVQISSETKKKILQFCVDAAGAPYGILEIVGFPWVMINSAFGRNVKNPFSNGKASFVCSEFIGDILKEVMECDLVDPESLNPKQIYRYLVQKFPNQ